LRTQLKYQMQFWDVRKKINKFFVPRRGGKIKSPDPKIGRTREGNNRRR